MHRPCSPATAKSLLPDPSSEVLMHMPQHETQQKLQVNQDGEHCRWVSLPSMPPSVVARLLSRLFMLVSMHLQGSSLSTSVRLPLPAGMRESLESPVNLLRRTHCLLHMGTYTIWMLFQSSGIASAHALRHMRLILIDRQCAGAQIAIDEYGRSIAGCSTLSPSQEQNDGKPSAQ